MLPAGKSLFSDALILKVMGELAIKLPLNFSAILGRIGTATSHADGRLPTAVVSDAASICQRSCNLLFDLVVQNIKQVRDGDEFLPIWTRFVTVLASNAQATRGAAPQSQQWWHDEMCDALEALLRLLRLPVAASSSALTKEDSVSPAAGNSGAAPSSTTSTGGFFSWFVAPLIAATDGPDVTGGRRLPESGSTGPHLGNLIIEPSDGFLLRLSWSHICSAYPTFPGSLRLRDPRLHARITSALKLPEVYFQKNSAPARAHDAASPQLSVPATTPASSSSHAEAAQDHVATPNAQVVPQLEPALSTSAEIAHVQVTSSLPVPSSIRSPAAVAELRGHVEASSIASVVECSLPSADPATPSTALARAMPDSHFDTISLTTATTPFSPITPFTLTPTKRPDATYDTPLADGKAALSFPTPVETPIAEHAHAPVSESAAKQAMPYVKNLTPIFASAEADKYTQERTIALTDSEGKGVVRKLQLGAGTSITTPITKSSAPPGDSPWQTYPVDTPPVRIALPQTADLPRPVPVSVPRSAAKGSRAQIV